MTEPAKIKEQISDSNDNVNKIKYVRDFLAGSLD